MALIWLSSSPLMAGYSQEVVVKSEAQLAAFQEEEIGFVAIKNLGRVQAIFQKYSQKLGLGAEAIFVQAALNGMSTVVDNERPIGIVFDHSKEKKEYTLVLPVKNKKGCEDLFHSFASLGKAEIQKHEGYETVSIPGYPRPLAVSITDQWWTITLNHEALQEVQNIEGLEEHLQKLTEANDVSLWMPIKPLIADFENLIPQVLDTNEVIDPRFSTGLPPEKLHELQTLRACVQWAKPYVLEGEYLEQGLTFDFEKEQIRYHFHYQPADGSSIEKGLTGKHIKSSQGGFVSNEVAFFSQWNFELGEDLINVFQLLCKQLKAQMRGSLETEMPAQVREMVISLGDRLLNLIEETAAEKRIYGGVRFEFAGMETTSVVGTGLADGYELEDIIGTLMEEGGEYDAIVYDYDWYKGFNIHKIEVPAGDQEDEIAAADFFLAIAEKEAYLALADERGRLALRRVLKDAAEREEDLKAAGFIVQINGKHFAGGIYNTFPEESSIPSIQQKSEALQKFLTDPKLQEKSDLIQLKVTQEKGAVQGTLIFDEVNLGWLIPLMK